MISISRKKISAVALLLILATLISCKRGTPVLYPDRVPGPDINVSSIIEDDGIIDDGYSLDGAGIIDDDDIIDNSGAIEYDKNIDNDIIGDASEQISRTVMIYIVGSDLESTYGAASFNISQILEAGIDLSWNTVLLMTGGAANWLNASIPSNENVIYRVSKNGLVNVSQSPAKNMGSPQTLSDFLTYCYTNYAADAYSLILWNHGGGPMFGFGYDELSGDILTLTEISHALEDSPFNKDNKLEWVGFDACLMGSIEVAFIFSDYAQYLIASQETIPGWGWDYSFLGRVGPDMAAEDVAEEIIESYFEFCSAIFRDRPDFEADITLSCLDLSVISDVEQGLNSLYAKASKSLDASGFRSFALSRSSVKEFGNFSMTIPMDLVDIQHLCNLMSKDYPSDAQVLSDALEQLVVYNRSNISNANGVSMYYPYRNKDSMNELAAVYDSLDFAGGYTAYMRQFIALLQGGFGTQWNLSHSMAAQESSTQFFVQLTPEQVENFVRATYIICEKNVNDDGTESYIILFNGTDVTLADDGKLYANYEGKTQVVYDKEEDSTGLCMLFEKECTDDYIRYHIPVMIVSWDPGFLFSGWLQLHVNRKDNSSKILAVVPFDSEDDAPVAKKQMIDIYDYPDIYFPYIERSLAYNEDGSLKPANEWEQTGTMYATYANLNQETKDTISFVQGELDRDKEYFLVFRITDIQENAYSSNLIPIVFE